MTTGGDAVLAVARGEIGYVEGANNSTKYWDWYGANLGSWCAVFVSWCAAMAGYPLCGIDSEKGFVLVSNGTWHSYTTGMASNTGLEAQRTIDLEPGDVVLYSWYAWDWWEGVPTIIDAEWYGWTAGDHTGIVNSRPDAAGYFTAVEGNTSDGSADNGGMVLERTRHISQVCGWYRFPNINNGAQPPEPPKPTYRLLELGMFILGNNVRGAWLMGPGYAKWLDPEEYSQVVAIPGMQTFETGDNQRAFEVVYNACMAGGMASET